jgi:ribonuclease P protein component
LRFPRAARLTRTGEFRRVKDQGRAWGGRFFVLSVLNPAPEVGASRIGLITSRRVGGAVSRNRVRRLLRDLLRRSRPRLRPGCWIVLIARHTAAKATLAELTSEWTRLAKRASLLLPTPTPTPLPSSSALPCPAPAADGPSAPLP